MKKLACFAVAMVLCLSIVMTALAYESGEITYSRSAPFFEYDQNTSTYISVHYWTVANIKHTFRVYSLSDNSAFTGAQTAEPTVTKTSNAHHYNISSNPNFSFNMTNNGTSITVSYSGGSYTVYYYGDYYYNENGVRVTMTNTMHNIIAPFTGSKTLTK